jgi:DNA polymerase-4
MPLRTAYQLCPQAIFVEGHPDRYREYSQKVYQVLTSFSPLVEMASIDEAYLDLTGTSRLYGPPLRAAHLLHERMKTATNLNCSIGIAASRLVAKIGSDQAKPNGIIWILPGQESSFLAPLDVRKVPGVGKVTEKNLRAVGIRKVGDLAQLDEAFLEQRFGKWGLALAGKSRGQDAGGWYDAEIGEGGGPKSISHEHTFSQDTAEVARLEATLSRLCEMVGRRLREHSLRARTIQLKLRYSDFSTITRAHSIPRGTELDTELFEEIRALFQQNWKPGATVRLLGVHVSSWTNGNGQMDLLGDGREERWQQTLAAADRLRDRFGESAVSLASGLRGRFRERTHENPAGLPGKRLPGKG